MSGEAATPSERALKPTRRRRIAHDSHVSSYYEDEVARPYRIDAASTGTGLATIKENLRNADLYLNLGQVYLLAGKIPQALEAFAQGLRVQPGDSALREALDRFDRRSAPPIPLLKRSHRLNRWLGRARGVVRARTGKT